MCCCEKSCEKSHHFTCGSDASVAPVFLVLPCVLRLFILDTCASVFFKPAASITSLEASIVHDILSVGPACHHFLSVDSCSPGLLLAPHWSRYSTKQLPQRSGLYAGKGLVRGKSLVFSRQSGKQSGCRPKVRQHVYYKTQTVISRFPIRQRRRL